MFNNFDVITQKITKGGEISPFLFLGQNLELIHGNLESYILDLLKEHTIDIQSFFHISDSGESIKIQEIKQFLAQGDVRPRFAFQVFLIENISRMTHQAQNACLKFFEEPGIGNIVILTNESESGILETILSRVQIVTLHSSNTSVIDGNSFYISMIENHVGGVSDELVRYFFSGKYEKQEYIHFLTSLISYISKSGKFREILDEIHEDIGGILKNNLQGKYIADKYIMKLTA